MKSNEIMFEEIVRRRDAIDAMRRKRRRIAAVLLIPALVLAAAVPTVLRYRTDRLPAESGPQSETAVVTTLPAGPVGYTALTGGALPVLAGSHMADMVGFDEGLLKGAAWVVEGTVLDVWTADHTYVVRAPGKFGAETMTITYPLQSNVTVFRVGRVFHGDPALAGQTLTLEDKLFLYDGHFGCRIGVTYIFGAVDLGEDAAIEHLNGDEELLSGDLTRNSRYATLYGACVPPIEKAANADGFLVPDCWVSLTDESDRTVLFDDTALAAAVPAAGTTALSPETQAGEDSYVAMQPGGNEIPPAATYYKDHIRFVPADVFEQRFNALLNELFS